MRFNKPTAPDHSSKGQPTERASLHMHICAAESLGSRRPTVPLGAVPSCNRDDARNPTDRRCYSRRCLRKRMRMTQKMMEYLQGPGHGPRRSQHVRTLDQEKVQQLALVFHARASTCVGGPALTRTPHTRKPTPSTTQSHRRQIYTPLCTECGCNMSRSRCYSVPLDDSGMCTAMTHNQCCSTSPAASA